MHFSQLDPEFKQLNKDLPEDREYLDPREAPFEIYGLEKNSEGSYCRLPLAFVNECSEGVQRHAWDLAGACIRFATDSSDISIVWELHHPSHMAHFTCCGQNGMELFEETESGARQLHNLIPQQMEKCQLKQSHVKPLPGGMRSYVLYLPLYNGLKQLYLGFAPGSRVEAGRKPKIEKPILYYGSSITQGGCATKAGSCYTTLLARRLDANQINLGFSGNAKGEENMARYIAGKEMSVFVMDYDHNAPNVEHLQATHEPFFRIIRKAQPDLPIVLVSRPDFDKNPQDSVDRRNVILRTYANALAAGDRNVHFVDGELFFGATDRDLCTVDQCHPTDIGFLRMADMMEPLLRRILGK